MEVHLTPELEAIVESKVSSGRYNSPTEVIKSALEILVLHDETELWKQEIRAQIEVGWDEALRGELVDADEVFDRIFSEVRAIEASESK